MKNIFLTGGTGFVGRTFHFACKDKFNISSPKSSDLNLTDYSSLEKFIKSYLKKIYPYYAYHIDNHNTNFDKPVIIENYNW